MSKRRAAAGGVILATGIAALGGTTAFADSGEPVQQPPQPEPQHQTEANTHQSGGLVDADVPVALDLHEGVANDLNAQDAVHDVVRVGDVIPAEKTNVSGDQRAGGGEQQAPQDKAPAPASTTSANADGGSEGGKGGAPEQTPEPQAPEANAQAQANGGGEATANAVSDLSGSVDGVVSSAQSSLEPTVDGVTSSASSTVSGVLDLSGGNGDNCPK